MKYTVHVSICVCQIRGPTFLFSLLLVGKLSIFWLASIFYKMILFTYYFRERRREGERERERKKHGCKRETSIGCFSFMHGPRTEPATQTCARNGNQTSYPSLCRTMPNQLSHKGQGGLLPFLMHPLSFLFL